MFLLQAFCTWKDREPSIPLRLLGLWGLAVDRVNLFADGWCDFRRACLGASDVEPLKIVHPRPDQSLHFCAGLDPFCNRANAALFGIGEDTLQKLVVLGINVNIPDQLHIDLDKVRFDLQKHVVIAVASAEPV